MSAAQSTWIKGCRVRDFDTIRSMAAIGFEFAGLHAINEFSPSTMAGIRGLARLTAEHDLAVKLVLLTKVADPARITDALEHTGMTWLQLHRRWPLDDLADLRDRLASRGTPVRIIVLVDPTENLAHRPERYLDVADFVILDRSAGGTGQPLPVESVRGALEVIDPRRTFIAGGLTSSNVGPVVRRHHPFAVDVQTGLLDAAGRHNPTRMAAFFDAVHVASSDAENPDGPDA